MTDSGIEPDTSTFVTTWTVDNPPYIILKWTIDNLCYADSLFRSPCFEVSPASKWNIILNPNVVIDGAAFIDIYLKRNAGSEPGQLMLKGEISLHGPSSELIYDKIFEDICDENDQLEFRLAKGVFPFHTTYIVRCELVISREINFSNVSTSHLQKLSMDFKQLYDDNKFTDISICTNDDVIYTHKALLDARSKYFATTLEENVTYVTEKNPYLSAVLLFMYTGDLDLLLSSVPLIMLGVIYSVAKKWQLNDLVNLLTPLKMHCKTDIRFENFQYTWEIKHFTKLSAEHCVLHSSEFFTKEHQNVRWRLVLEKHLRGNEELYGLYLEKVSSASSLFQKTNVEFCIYYNKKKCILRNREFIFGTQANRKCGFSPIFDKSVFQVGSIQDDTLKVICVLKIRLDSDSWIDFKSTMTDVSDKDTCCSKYLKALSSNLKELYLSQKYADLKLYAGQEMIMVHKAMLHARSAYFSNILSQHSAEYIAVEVQHDILKEILLYIYSAELPTLTLSNMVKMYEAAFLLKLSDLLSMCKSYIILHITVTNVLEIMVLAHKLNDKDLEEVTTEFASRPENAKEFLNTRRWRNFREKYTSLAITVYHNLSWSFCQHY